MLCPVRVALLLVHVVWYGSYYTLCLVDAVSSEHKWNLEELMEEIWERCNMLRIYTKVSLLCISCSSSSGGTIRGKEHEVQELTKQPVVDVILAFVRFAFVFLVSHNNSPRVKSLTMPSR
jgi:ribosome-interacting GTPase 1